MKSLSGILIKSCDAPDIWKSTKQTITVKSTTDKCESEFVACSSASREVVWARNFLSELGFVSLSEPTELKVDNQSAIKLVKNTQIRSRIKQLDVRLMAVRERERG